jgi:hypothetical protein
MKNTFGNLAKGFVVGAITGMIVLHYLCKNSSKKKIKHSTEQIGENICSMFKLK